MYRYRACLIQISWAILLFFMFYLESSANIVQQKATDYEFFPDIASQQTRQKRSWFWQRKKNASKQSVEENRQKRKPILPFFSKTTEEKLKQAFGKFNLEKDSRNAEQLSEFVSKAISFIECTGNFATEGLYRKSGSIKDVNGLLLDYLTYASRRDAWFRRAGNPFAISPNKFTVIDVSHAVRKFFALQKESFFSNQFLDAIHSILQISHQTQPPMARNGFQQNTPSLEIFEKNLDRIELVIVNHLVHQHYKIRLMRHIAESMAKVRQCTPTLATAYNLATVWAPNLFRDAGNDKHSIISLITYGFLNHHRRLFRRLEAGERDDVKPVCRNEWPCNKTISSPSFTPLTKRQFSTEDGGKPSPVWGADHRQNVPTKSGYPRKPPSSTSSMFVNDGYNNAEYTAIHNERQFARDEMKSRDRNVQTKTQFSALPHDLPHYPTSPSSSSSSMFVNDGYNDAESFHHRDAFRPTTDFHSKNTRPPIRQEDGFKHDAIGGSAVSPFSTQTNWDAPTYTRFVPLATPLTAQFPLFPPSEDDAWQKRPDFERTSGIKAQDFAAIPPPKTYSSRESRPFPNEYSTIGQPYEGTTIQTSAVYHRQSRFLPAVNDRLTSWPQKGPLGGIIHSKSIESGFMASHEKFGISSNKDLQSPISRIFPRVSKMPQAQPSPNGSLKMSLSSSVESYATAEGTVPTKAEVTARVEEEMARFARTLGENAPNRDKQLEEHREHANAVERRVLEREKELKLDEAFDSNAYRRKLYILYGIGDKMARL